MQRRRLRDELHPGPRPVYARSSFGVLASLLFHAELCSYAHKISERNSIVLRADSPALRDQWLQAIAEEIKALRALAAPADASDSPPIADTAAPAHDMQAFAGAPCNAECADCGAAAPRWASVTHQVLICVECAGVHRSGRPALHVLTRLKLCPAETSGATSRSCRGCSTTRGRRRAWPRSRRPEAISWPILNSLSTTFQLQF